MARRRYLKKTPLEEARRLFLAGIDSSKLTSETVPVEDALDRVTAEPVFAKISSPHYHAAAMDGICVRAEDTFGATELVGKKLTRASADSSGPGAFAYADTGNALPAWANAVINRWRSSSRWHPGITSDWLVRMSSLRNYCCRVPIGCGPTIWVHCWRRAT